MKYFLYLMSGILIIALMGLFFLKKPDGKTWLTVNELVPNASVIERKVKYIKNKLLIAYQDITSEGDQNDKVTIYRWKDSQGNWSYSDAPQGTSESEEVLLNPNDIVVLPALKTSNNTANSATLKTNEKPSAKSVTTSPSNVLNLYKDANNVQKLMDERQKNISKAIKASQG